MGNMRRQQYIVVLQYKTKANFKDPVLSSSWPCWHIARVVHYIRAGSFTKLGATVLATPKHRAKITVLIFTITLSYYSLFRDPTYGSQTQVETMPTTLPNKGETIPTTSKTYGETILVTPEI